MRARYRAGLYPLEDFAPLLRRPAGAAGMDRADRWIGLSDGGAGLEARLRENFPRVEVIILDFSHPAEKLTGLARLMSRLYSDQAEWERAQAHLLDLAATRFDRATFQRTLLEAMTHVGVAPPAREWVAR